MHLLSLQLQNGAHFKEELSSRNLFDELEELLSLIYLHESSIEVL